MTATPQTAPLTLRRHFASLLSAIEPPTDRVTKAVELHTDLREYLKDTSALLTTSPHTRLSGSYPRHTATGAIKDVDVIVFVSATGEEPDPYEVLEALYSTLRKLPEALSLGGKATILRRQRRSVHFAFDDEDFHFDVVPALIPGGVDAPLRVPDREWNQWVDSHPLGYAAALSDLNTTADAKVVPLIKMMKHWRGQQMTYRRPKSYWLECLVYQHLSEGLVATANVSYAELFVNTLVSIRNAFQPTLDWGVGVPEIPDPMLGHNVAFNWERAAFETFMSRLGESISWAQRALAQEQDEDGVEAAVKLWRKMFGDLFPDGTELKKAQIAEFVASRGTFVSGTGNISIKRPTDTTAVRSPQHRFYGSRRER